MLDPRVSPGRLIAGRYRIDRHLGEGGMGTVWAARHEVTRRLVAIKLLKEPVQHKSDVRQRFLQEARAASALRHPNVVEVIDVFDLEDGSPVMVMELLEGETLGDKLARDERLSTEETAALLIPVVAAVESAHVLGIVHRDLKPENIFIADDGTETRVKVLDFGVAKLAAEHYRELGQSVLVTEAGAMLGTPCYMAPEQLTNEGVDHHADVWSLGVIAYECLSGVRPVEGQNLAEVVTRLVTGAITPLDRLAPELPRDVTAIVQEMLTRDVKRRLHDLGEFTKVLSRYTRVRAPVAGPDGRISDPGRVPAPSLRVLSGRPSSAAGSSGRKSAPPSATMMSAPAVDVDSRPSAPTSAPSSGTAWPLRRTITLATALGIVAALGATFGLRGRSKTAVSEPSGTPAASIEKPAPGRSMEPSMAAVPDAPVEPAASGPLSPAVPAPMRVAAGGASSSRRVPAARPAAAASGFHSVEAKPKPKNDNDESTLFSGRK
jgi:serine/threonine protein kinase